MKYQVDDEVLYIPDHAGGCPEHPACERGTVSTVADQGDGTQKVWVRYTSGSTGALTPTKNLSLLKTKQ